MKKDVEVLVFVENTRVDEFILTVELASFVVFFEKAFVRELVMRILVQHLHVGVGGGAVEVVVDFLHVLAMIALNARKPEQPLF